MTPAVTIPETDRSETDDDRGGKTMTEHYDQPMVGPLDAPERPSGRHPVNITQLVMAVAFAGLLLVWGLYQLDVVDRDDFRWLLPIPWLAAGAAGLAATLLPSRRDRNAAAGS
jgi:hypothetical protein